MNYYPHHIGDYLRDTSHLSLVEHGAYRRMLDVYYATEKPLPRQQEKIYRLIGAKTSIEKLAVDVVLGEFWIESEEGWRNSRADAELAKAQQEGAENKARKESEAERQRRHRERRKNLFAGLREHGMTPPWDATTEELQNALEKVLQRDSNAPVTPPVTRTDTATPVTNNQEPITKSQRVEKQQRSRGSRLPPSWEPSESLKAWATKERPDLDGAVTLDRFRDYWAGVPGSKGLKLDWDATYRNWVRAERAGSKPKEIDYEALAKRLEEQERANASV